MQLNAELGEVKLVLNDDRRNNRRHVEGLANGILTTSTNVAKYQLIVRPMGRR